MHFEMNKSYLDDEAIRKVKVEIITSLNLFYHILFPISILSKSYF